MIEIQSRAIYASNNTAFVTRLDSYGKVRFPIWPQIQIGETVRVLDDQGWYWTVTVKDSLVLDDGVAISFNGEIVGEKEATPLPEVPSNGVLRTPALAGHAHFRAWEKGYVVQIQGDYYKVKKAAYVPQTGTNNYTLERTTEDEYRKRPWKKRVEEHRINEVIGQALEIQGEWLHVKKVTYTRFGSAIGGGRVYWAKGNFVSEAKAKSLNDTHPAILSRDLRNAPSVRAPGPMPEGAVQLTPKKLNSLAATGTRVAVDGKSVLFEQAGDPDQIDSYYHYTVRIDDPSLVARVAKYVKKAQGSKANKVGTL